MIVFSVLIGFVFGCITKDLLMNDDYIELQQRYNDCEKEYRRLAGCYNALLEQNRQLQAKLNNVNIKMEVE